MTANKRLSYVFLALLSVTLSSTRAGEATHPMVIQPIDELNSTRRRNTALLNRIEEQITNFKLEAVDSGK